MIRRPPRSTLSSSSAASDVYKRQVLAQEIILWSGNGPARDVVPVGPHSVTEPVGRNPGAAAQLAEVGTADVHMPELAAGPECLSVEVDLDIGKPSRQVVHTFVHAHRRSSRRAVDGAAGPVGLAGAVASRG